MRRACAFTTLSSGLARGLVRGGRAPAGAKRSVPPVVRVRGQFGRAELPARASAHGARLGVCGPSPPRASLHASPATTPATAPAEAERARRVLSGVQPTGALHLGNYLGAMRQWTEKQDQFDSFFFVVDLHAITVPHDRRKLAECTRQAVAMYLACGVDPDRSTIFVQSHVRAHAELTWLLNCNTPIGWLERMIQFKEKARKEGGENASVGLFDYPILMAADVLLYQTDVVPVGEDQRQHIELARDIARRYNDLYCKKKRPKTFREPKALMQASGARVMSLEDGAVKMSKSAANDGSRINLVDPPTTIRNKIKRCKTDSAEGLAFDDPNRPECNNLLSIYQLVTGSTKEEVAAECGAMRWGQFKPLLADALVAHLEPIQARYDELLNDTDYINAILKRGAEAANTEAERTLDAVKRDLGLLLYSARTRHGLRLSSDLHARLNGAVDAVAALHHFRRRRSPFHVLAAPLTTNLL